MVIRNKFPELDGHTPLDYENGFLSSISGYGYNEVLIESPNHFDKFENMDMKKIGKATGAKVVATLDELGKDSLGCTFSLSIITPFISLESNKPPPTFFSTFMSSKSKVSFLPDIDLTC